MQICPVGTYRQRGWWLWACSLHCLHCALVFCWSTVTCHFRLINYSGCCTSSSTSFSFPSSLPCSSSSALFLTVLPGLTLPHTLCSLEFMVILLPQSSKCCDDRHELPHLLIPTHPAFWLAMFPCTPRTPFFSILLALSILLCNSILEVHFPLHPRQDSTSLKLIPLTSVWHVHVKVWLGSREGLGYMGPDFSLEAKC